MDDFTRALHDTVLKAGAKDLARQMGVSHVSLLQRTNPNDDAHQTTVGQYYQILRHSGDLSSLRALAAEFDHDLEPKRPTEALSITDALMRMHVDVADVTRVTADAMADGRITQAEKRAVLLEIDDAIRSLDALRFSVRSA